MPRRQFIHFGLIALFAFAAVTFAFGSWRTLSKLQKDLPTVSVQLHRVLATQFEALTRLSRELARFDHERTAFRLNDVNLAIATVMAIDRQHGAALESFDSGKIRAARERLPVLQRQIESWSQAGQQPADAEIPRAEAELVEITAAFDTAISDLNRETISSLEAQRSNLGTFKLWLWTALVIVSLSTGGIAAALLWQCRTANRLRDALQDIELGLARALNAVSDGFALYGPDGRLQFHNANYRDLIGETPEVDLVGRDYQDVLRCAVARKHYPAARDDPDAWIAERCRQFRRDHSETEIEIQDDRWCLVESTRSADGRTVHVLAEVTELKRRENALKRTEARLEEAQTLARIGNWEFDMTSRQLWWSNELYRIFGIDPEAEPVVEGDFATLVQEDERDEVRQALYDTMNSRGAISLTCGVVTRDGRDRQIELHARVESDPKTSRLTFKGTVQDVTEKHQATDSLKRAEVFLRTVTDNLPVQIAYIDLEHRFQFMNRTGAQWLARAPKDIVGKKVAEIVGEENYAPRRTYIEAALQGETIDARTSLTYPDGITRELDVTYVPNRDVDGKVIGCCALVIDVTEDVKRKDLLNRAQKMEAIGQLTGGIAHDFNNILGVIIGNLQLVMRDLTDENELRRTKSAEKAALRGAELTSRLLAFSRRQVLQPQVIDVNKLVLGMDDMLRRTIGENVEIETVLSAGLWPTKTDPSQLENALLNMAVNARDAMPHGGQLTIETANTRLDEAYVRGHPYVEAGQYVMLAVTDTGTGIPKDVLEHVFEPFFTTKEQGKGTGLGLSMVYGFAKQSGGHANVYSEVGTGTTVRVYLPRTKAVASIDQVARAIEPDEFPSGNETILVVEDDPSLRETAVELLTDLGYTVLEAAHGREALDLLTQEPHVDLLLTDIVMPGGMSGIELSREARQLLPALKVILTSGYAHNGAVHRGIAEEGAHWISKPYDLARLAQKIREVLDD